MIAVMKKILAICAIALAFSASAQQSPRPSDDEINARFQVMAAQRNRANDEAAVLQARLAVVEQELAKAKEAVCKPEPKQTLDKKKD